ncbi:MAG: hypothetical protein J6I76_03020 [Oribacterium sp.]|nr:hypothetical protein [Oribacterium sp.]
MNKDLVKRIIVEYGGYFDGGEKRILTHDGDKILVEREFYNGASDDGKTLYSGKNWSSLIDDLNKLNIDNWDEKYDDPDVMDGVQWMLDIQYENDGKCIHCWGSNKFPKNFNDFLKVVEM